MIMKPNSTMKPYLFQLQQRYPGRLFALSPVMWVFVIALIGLPFVVFYSIRDHAESEAQRNARQFNQLISTMRSYYNQNVAGRILNSGGAPITLTENYHNLPGGVPIPATLSIELGDALRERMLDQGFAMAFVSDAPFKQRQREPLDPFQTSALAIFRQDASLKETWRLEDTDFGGQRVRLAVPVRMEAACVACHNNHPNSPVRTWQVGDVRGIQDISVDMSLAEQTDDTLFLSLYLLFFTGSSLAALAVHRRANQKLQTANDDLYVSQQYLEDSEQQLKLRVDELSTMKAVLDKAPFGISFADPHQPDMPLVYVNDAFVEQTGYSSEEALGQNCRFLQGPGTQPEVVQQIREALREHKSLEVELINYRRNGEPFWNRFLIFPSYDAQGQLIHFVGCQTDITALKEAEERRQQIEAELQESLKLESLGLTIAGIAHDLNTPIGVSLTAASHMEQQVRKLAVLTADPERNAEQLQKLSSGVIKSAGLVSSNLNKAARLVRSFKQTTADATRHEWRKVNVKDYLESLLVSVSPLLNRAQCKLSLSCPEHLVVMTEPGSLTQALSNLLVNATVHAFEGCDDRRLELSVEAVSGGLVIKVSDNGNGMSEEAIAKAFTPFFTTRRGAGGSGLGLFSTRRVVEEIFGGRIELHSQAGAGTTFVIHLPDTPPAGAVSNS
jgi:PAS domain S-box-containing protein